MTNDKFITVKCTKCGKPFKKDPRLATIFMLCEDCEQPAYDLPEGFQDIFGGKI